MRTDHVLCFLSGDGPVPITEMATDDLERKLSDVIQKQENLRGGQRTAAAAFFRRCAASLTEELLRRNPNAN